MKTSFRKLYITVFLISLGYTACIKQNPVPDNSTGLSSLRDTILKNRKYGIDSPRQIYDIHLPANRDTSTNIILVIHGGGWKTGRKEDMDMYVNLLKSKWKNIAVVNMNYRYASFVSKIHHDELMADIQAAVNKVMDSLTYYKIGSKLAVVGGSAGAQMAMIYSYRVNNKIKCVGNVFGPSIMNDWAWYNSTNYIQGTYNGSVIAEYVGKSWDTTLYKSLSPYWNVSSLTPPTISFHGNLDPVVPVYHSQWLHTRLRSFGVPSEYHEYVAFHSFDGNQADDVVNKLVAFFKIHLK
jgi:dipeptidyl aminopeptidase/acylaminoacyl peptidase